MASKGGSPTHPDWFHNLVAHPSVTVEADGERFDACAMPFFGAYERRVKRREIPVILLERDRR
jgi:hypothetical protein